MGWGRFFLLGDLGQQLDIQDQQTQVRRLQGQQWSKDRSQDEQIAELQAEIVDLKRYIGGLCQLMIAKGILPEADVASLAATVYEPAKPTPAIDPTLRDLQDAVEETEFRPRTK
jgi:hypothetical protein